jgi:hypothetical protein
MFLPQQMLKQQLMALLGAMLSTRSCRYYVKRAFAPDKNFANPPPHMFPPYNGYIRYEVVSPKQIFKPFKFR